MATKSAKTATKVAETANTENETITKEVTTTAAENEVTTEETVTITADEAVTTEKTAKARKYEPNDLIPCRSIYAGCLLFYGDKSKITYEFSNIGDFRYIEYQDLLAGLLMKKKSIFAPYVIIDDEELLNTTHWKQIKEIYDGMYTADDLMKLIDMPTVKFNDEFRKLPVGYRTTIATLVSELISEGKFDSMNKIKIIDEVCGTDLKIMLQAE